MMPSQLVAVMGLYDHYTNGTKLLHRILYDGAFCTGTWHWKQDRHRAVCVSAQSLGYEYSPALGYGGVDNKTK